MTAAPIARRAGGSLRDALAALKALRRADDVVLTTMTPARDWMALGTHPLDLVLVPSAMGHATSMGLGLALAQPDRRIIVCNGDGSLLMNLGSLVSITAAGPRNLVVLVFVNGTYEATGAQPTPGSAEGRVAGDAVDFAAMARACGFRAVFDFPGVEGWRAGAETVLATEGPTIAIIGVTSDPTAPGPKSPGPAAARASRFIEALRTQPGRSGEPVPASPP
ncbi:MAG TPA: thiamine pyrophosphate-dependent enzyme [Gemmatimonadaceae bacterium]|nr:thiamine pyrophosphate-dependent enzyme [Gemmatimonadaceae bacterium]